MLPVAVTYCHEGSGIGGLSGSRIEPSSSFVPPALGVQSSQPTLPGLFLQRGTITRVFFGQIVEVLTASPVPSQVTTVTGAVSGRTVQPDPAEHAPCRNPVTAVAVVLVRSCPMPMMRETNELKSLRASMRTPATEPTVALGQSGSVWLFVGSEPAPTTAASPVPIALVPSDLSSVPQMSV